MLSALASISSEVAGVNVGWSRTASEAGLAASNTGLCCGVFVILNTCADRLGTRLPQPADRCLADHRYTSRLRDVDGRFRRPIRTERAASMRIGAADRPAARLKFEANELNRNDLD